ncbi:hypothetical protein BDN67DRAFT_1013272 [Paxillus ammoniavirescens]|nr:hypothetical protein BDN67DRAFT_1013272 [Paxillus ammoniavirescens]
MDENLGDIFNAALRINPTFNMYRIWDTYPILWDILGSPSSFFKNSPNNTLIFGHG